MQKALLVSILFANVIVPLWAARDPSAKRGLKKTVVILAVFDVFYLLGLMYVYPRL